MGSLESLLIRHDDVPVLFDVRNGPQQPLAIGRRAQQIIGFVGFTHRDFNLFVRERLFQAIQELLVELLRACPVNCKHNSCAFVTPPAYPLLLTAATVEAALSAPW